MAASLGLKAALCKQQSSYHVLFRLPALKIGTAAGFVQNYQPCAVGSFGKNTLQQPGCAWKNMGGTPLLLKLSCLWWASQFEQD